MAAAANTVQAVGTYLVTGASSGIGLALVTALAARGDKVYATVRTKTSSNTGVDSISAVEGDVTVIEGIDITDDKVGDALTAALEGVTLDVVVHNAGSLNGTRDVTGMAVMTEQKLEAVTMDRMRAAFEVNTLGPLRVQQAVLPMTKSPGGKVAIVSTGLASIGDNGSGGNYAYRTSKAGVNMIAKSMSVDLKDKEIAVCPITPGFAITEFGPGAAALESMGAKPVDEVAAAMISIIDGMSMENTGTFQVVRTGGYEGPTQDISTGTMEW